MKYLVTGGAGFIGSHVVRTLLNQGVQVRVLDNFSTGKRENVAGLNGLLEILEGDLRDSTQLEEAVRDVEVIIHLGAFVSVPASLTEPQTCFDVNVLGTLKLFEAACRAGVRRVVIASSAAVYGDSESLPLGEESKLHPLSAYAASKQVAEVYAALYTRSLGLEVAALRYFNVYGPRQSPDSQYAAAVPSFIRQLLNGSAVTVFGDGNQTRDLIYVQDVVRASLMAAEHPQAPGRVFNICSGRETRLLDLVQVLYRIFPEAPEPVFSAPRAGDIYRSVGSPERAARIMGFQAGITLEQGLKETVEWLRN